MKKTQIGLFLLKSFEITLSVLLSSIIIFYLFKKIYGLPNQIKEDSKIIREINNNMDSIYALQNLTYEHISSIRNNQNELNDLMSQNNQLILNNNTEITSMKKVVNSKINLANSIIYNKKNTGDSKKTYNAIDSFFKSRNSKSK